MSKKNKTLKEEFEEKVKELDDIGAMHHDFGYKMEVADNDGSKSIFTVPDWVNIWNWFESKLNQREAEVREEERNSFKEFIDKKVDFELMGSEYKDFFMKFIDKEFNKK